jgi:hypothetical protein
MSSQNAPRRSGPTLAEVLGKVRVSTAAAALGFTVAAIGSIGPWATVLGLLSVDGTAGDGRITLGLAVFAVLALVIGRGASVASAIAALVALAIGVVAVIDLVDLDHVTTSPTVGDAVSAGWGLYAVLAGAVIALAAIAPEVTILRPRPLPATLRLPPLPAQPQQVTQAAPLPPTTVGSQLGVAVLGVTLAATVLAVRVFGL